MSLGQEALWFLQNLAPDSSAYNVSGALNLHFTADPAVLAAAVREVIAGHTSLNCVFRPVGGEVRRVPADTLLDSALEIHELAAGDEGAAEDYPLAVARRPFRLDRQLPVRIALLHRPDGPDVLLAAAHHIAVDNISLVLIVREILSAYAALITGREHAVADTGADFDELVDRQRRFLSSPRADAAREYWRGELAGAADGDLPTDRPRPEAYRFAGSQLETELPGDLMAAIERAATERDTTSFAYLFSVFQLLLYAYGGRTDALIGYPVSLRSGRRYRGSIGYFVNTLPFRSRIDPDDSFDALLRGTSERLWGALRHREYPFALMPRLVEAARDPSRAGLVPVMFAMLTDDQDDPFFRSLVPGRHVTHAGLDVSGFHLPQQQGQFDLTLQVHDHGSHATAALKYNTSLFTAPTARGLARGVTDLLESAVRDELPSRLRDVRLSESLEVRTGC